MNEFYFKEDEDKKEQDDERYFMIFNEFEDFEGNGESLFEEYLPEVFDYTKGELSKMKKKQILKQYEKEQLIDLLDLFIMNGDERERNAILREMAENLPKKDIIEFTMRYHKTFVDENIKNNKMELIKDINREGLKQLLAYAGVYHKRGDKISTLRERVVNSVEIEDIEDFLADYEFEEKKEEIINGRIYLGYDPSDHGAFVLLLEALFFSEEFVKNFEAKNISFDEFKNTVNEHMKSMNPDKGVNCIEEKEIKDIAMRRYRENEYFIFDYAEYYLTKTEKSR